MCDNQYVRTFDVLNEVVLIARLYNACHSSWGDYTSKNDPVFYSYLQLIIVKS